MKLLFGGAYRSESITRRPCCSGLHAEVGDGLPKCRCALRTLTYLMVITSCASMARVSLLPVPAKRAMARYFFSGRFQAILRIPSKEAGSVRR